MLVLSKEKNMTEKLVAGTIRRSRLQLKKKFGIGRTSDFWDAALAGKIVECERWLKHIEKHKSRFHQYDQQWMKERKNELAILKRKMSSPETARIKTLSKKEGQAELKRLFGIKDTADFQIALREGKIEFAESWLDHIESNPYRYFHYFANWEKWFKTRREELEAKKGG